MACTIKKLKTTGTVWTQFEPDLLCIHILKIFKKSLDSWSRQATYHVEEGEEDYEAAIRETKEEVGLVEGNDFKVLPDFKFNVSYEVNNIRDGNKRKSITLWLGKITNPTNCVVQSLPEHQGYQWVEFKEAIDCIGRRPGYQSWISCLEACNERIISSDIRK